MSDDPYQRKRIAIGAGGDRILAEGPRAAVVARALERLEQLVPPGATLLALPEGVALNYWLRRESPTRHTLFLPTELRALGGEEPVLAELAAHPPDFVALVHRRYQEFGVPPFGSDPRSGRRIAEWVEANYRRVDRIGAEPFRGRHFGIDLLERRADASR